MLSLLSHKNLLLSTPPWLLMEVLCLETTRSLTEEGKRSPPRASMSSGSQITNLSNVSSAVDDKCDGPSHCSKQRKSTIKGYPHPRLEGKVALITGGASGIGEATARLFAEHGAAVVIADISTDLGCNVAASLPNASFIKCDVTDEEQVSTAVNFTVKTYGALHILFSNAGIMGPFSGILDMDLGSFDSVIAVNLRGVAATLKHGSRAMVDGGIRGSIICTGSVAGCLGGAASAAYTAAKHGLVGLVKAACAELGEYGIRVNCVSPFGVATPMVCAAFELEPEEYEKRPLAVANLKGLTLKTNHIADTALFLASDESFILVAKIWWSTVASRWLLTNNICKNSSLTADAPYFP